MPDVLYKKWVPGLNGTGWARKVLTHDSSGDHAGGEPLDLGQDGGDTGDLSGAVELLELVRPVLLDLAVLDRCHYVAAVHGVDQQGREMRGLAMHIGQRVCAAAHPGALLVSSTVRDLLIGSNLKFADAGEHQLKGIPEAWHLYALVV